MFGKPNYTSIYFCRREKSFILRDFELTEGCVKGLSWKCGLHI